MSPNMHLNGTRMILLLFFVTSFIKFGSGQTLPATMVTSAGTEMTSTNITTQISLTSEILTMVTSTIITTQTSATASVTATMQAGTEVTSTNITTQIPSTSEILTMVTSTIITAQTSATSSATLATTTTVQASVTSAGTETTLISSTFEILTMVTSTIITIITTQTSAFTNFTTSGAPAIFTTPTTQAPAVFTTANASKETTQTSLVQTMTPVSSSHSLANSGRPPITLPPKETTTTINQCTDTKNCRIDTETKATGKVFTSTAPDQKTSIGNDKTITKFTTTTYTQTITRVYPGYTTTITYTTDGTVASYETYYPPSTVVVYQPVTATIPMDDSLGTSNSIGFKDNNGLVNILWSLWLVGWSLVYMILT
ncbi:9761_t:CDS:2 [Racocetra persica]|uniref:9761_t:CDS:1 n=1 Tax=Racocetra persica TaxID=160502 RepID=A0ACA9KVN3_9GLOM|nr:9761_t:CDS:2 [Racocetra persica]